MKSYKNISRENLIKKLNEHKNTLEEYKKFKVLFDCSPESVLFGTDSGQILDCNKSALLLLGYHKDEMIQLSLLDIMCEDITDKLPDLFKEELKSGGIVIKGTLKKKKGHLFPVEILTKLIEIDGKKCRFAVIHDLSKYQEIKTNTAVPYDKIKTLASLLPELIDEPEIIFDTDVNGYVTSANEYFFNLSGYTNEDIKKGLKLVHLVSPESRKKVKKTFKKVLKGESLEINEYKAIKKDGSFIHVMVYSTPIELHNEIIGIRTLALDITEHKNIEKKLVTMEKFTVLGELSGGVVHDIKNILAIILGYMELSIKKTRNYPECKLCVDLLKKMKRAALDGSCILKRIQNVSENSEYRKSDPVQINNLIEEVLEFLEPVFENKAKIKGITITVEKNLSPIPPVQARPAELREAFNNIIINSIDAMHCDGTITIDTTDDDYYVIISISDTGKGMSKKTISTVFDPFFTTKEHDGTGLGLFATQRIINKYGGKIEVLSEEGDGSTFKIFLPAENKKTTPEEKIYKKKKSG